MAIFAVIGCERCFCAYEDEWPDLPQTERGLRAWVALKGCPMCGDRRAEVEYVNLDEDDDD